MNYDIIEEIAKLGDLSIKYKNIHINQTDPEKMQQLQIELESIIRSSDDVKKNIGTVKIWVQLGRVLDKSKDPLCYQCFKIAILQDPNFAPAYYYLGVALDDDAEKIKYFRKAVEVEPNNSVAWHYLGAFLTDDKEKEKCFRRAIELNPSNSIAWNNLGTILKDEKEKEKCYRKAIELDPDNENAWFSLGMLLYDESYLERARQLGYDGWIPNSLKPF